MQTKTPSPDHEQFDAICAQVDEWEPLPAMTAAPASAAVQQSDEEEPAAPIDGLILAGLVSPY